MDVYQPRSPWFLYSVNIYKYDIWHSYSSIFGYYFRSRNYWMINICYLSWPIFCWKSVQNPTYNREQCFLVTVGGIGMGVLNYDTFFHCKELQNSRKLFYDKQTKDYRICCLKMGVAQSCQYFRYSLAWRHHTHVQGVQFFLPWTTAILFRYICIRKHSMKERIPCK